MLKDFFNLFFPDSCVGCHGFLVRGEKDICTKCIYSLSKSNRDPYFNDRIRKKFWGKLQIDNCVSYLKYQKGGLTQRIIFAIKYDDKKELGKMLGTWFGNEIKNLLIEKKVDIIVPVPLHKRKQRERGFNQSLWIAQGIADSVGKEVSEDLVVRTDYGLSLTKNNRLNRWVNSQNIYKLNVERDLVEGKHILIVDDVITTGATFEALAAVLLEAGAARISIAALAAAV